MYVISNTRCFQNLFHKYYDGALKVHLSIVSSASIPRAISLYQDKMARFQSLQPMKGILPPL